MLIRFLPVILAVASVIAQVQSKPEDGPKPYTVSEAYEV
jgi:hypothetical protein